MSIPFTEATKGLHEQAIDAVIQATDAADKNEQERVKGLIQQAKIYAALTVRKLKAMGMHRQADEYLTALNEHINRVWSLATRRHADQRKDTIKKAKDTVADIRKDTEKCGCQSREMSKEGDCQCGTMDKSLAKGFNSPFVSASSARKEYMENGSVKSTWTPTSVKADLKHSYKMMHELSPQQQEQVQHKFPQGSHSRYAYPVDRETGELVHGQRVPLPPGMAVRAQSAAFKEIKPEHKSGAFVKIYAPGHSAHGKKGVVMGPNPNVPGKVGVQIGATKAHSIYVEPHQVKLSKASSRVEKAMQTLFSIQKAFMKSESDDAAKSSID